MARVVFIQQVCEQAYLHLNYRGQGTCLRRFQYRDASPQEWRQYTLDQVNHLLQQPGNQVVEDRAPALSVENTQFWYDHIQTLWNRNHVPILPAGKNPPPRQNEPGPTPEPLFQDAEEPIGIRGYSERGMMNALFYEMRYSPDGICLLRQFLNQCTFPFLNPRPDFSSVTKAKIIIEQSFSDFGDLDVLLLLDDQSGQKSSIFLEAKVKTFQANFWSITDHWNEFTRMVREQRPGSNLFIQLYRKMRLVRSVQAPDEQLPADNVAVRWALGNNGVVVRAAQDLIPYCQNSRFLALVPDAPQRVAQFFCNQLVRYVPTPEELPDWNVTNWGHLTWREWEDYCRQQPHLWEHAIENFEYNNGQIYARSNPLPPPQQGLVADVRQPQPQQPPPPGAPVIWDNRRDPPRHATIRNRGRNNTRITFDTGEQEVVPNDEIREQREGE